MHAEGAIKECLRTKHSKDLVVEECKDGPTQTGSHLRMDMWVMPRSWSKPACTAYEIKVSRGDFLKDDKWVNYLNLCNYFYFVCPYGLIEPGELPENVGLMWLSKTGTRLYTKRKAAHRDVTIPESVWRYVLMCRARIDREHRFNDSEREYWQQWLEHERIDREFGYHVSRRISQRVNEEVIKANERSQKAEQAISQYEEVRRILSEVLDQPVSLHNPPSPWGFRRQLEELQDAVPPRMRHDLRRLGQRLQEAVDQIEQHEDKVREATR